MRQNDHTKGQSVPNASHKIQNQGGGRLPHDLRHYLHFMLLRENPAQKELYSIRSAEPFCHIGPCLHHGLSISNCPFIRLLPFVIEDDI